MIFDLERLDITDASFLLPLNVGGKLRRGQRLAVVDGDKEVGGDDGQCRVFAASLCDVLAHAVEVANHVVDDGPVVKRIMFDGFGGQARNQFLPFKMV